jgi:hypothetical protein
MLAYTDTGTENEKVKQTLQQLIDNPLTPDDVWLFEIVEIKNKTNCPIKREDNRHLVSSSESREHLRALIRSCTARKAVV